MKTTLVKDLMTPLSDYAVISEEATLYDAVESLKSAQKDYNNHEYDFRAILVINKSGKIVGKVSQFDILLALEPRYNDVAKELESSSKSYFDASFLESMLTEYSFWNKPLDNICKKAANKKIKEFMYAQSKGEFIDENSTLDQGIHKLVMGKHHSILVTKGDVGEIVGVLRLADIFNKVSIIMETCGI